MCSNNYLGFANHPALKEAARAALEQYGTGTVAARSLSGSTPLHEELEAELAVIQRNRGCTCLQFRICY